MIPFISVVTCSHNPKTKNLFQVIESLKNQTFDLNQWEFLLIDNGSSEPLEGRVDLLWHPRARHIREDKLGLTPARLRGIREARGEILVFVDDDNVLDANYLETVLAIAEKSPFLGAWSGQNLPEFETEPPEWTKRYWGNLAIRFIEQDQWSNLPHLPETMPCGAGLCIRRIAAQHYVYLHESGQREIVLDRNGNSLMSAGDNDLGACACDVGLGVGVFASLKLTHLMPANRLEEEYLLRLVEGVAFSGVVFRSFRNPGSLPDHNRMATRVADTLRLLLMKPQQRRFYRVYRRGELRACQQLTYRRSISQNSERISNT